MNEHGGFERFLETRGKLASILTELAKAFPALGSKERSTQLGDARKTLESDAFRLMVVGEFKRGKSTLVNSLLGKDVLPARVAPCTAIITEVRYAEQPRAKLHYADGKRPAIEVPVADLKKYVVIEDGDEAADDPSNGISASPYSLMELYYPLELCRNNVQLVDSPGLNEHGTRTRVALDFLSKADALVLVLSCQQALSESELKFIETQLGNRNLRHVFFVWNHFDAVIDSPEDVEDIKKRSRRYLEPKVGSGARVFYLSARMALLGKKAGDTAQLARSGMPPFEKALEQFLATERGRVKLLGPLRMAETAVREATTELIPRAEAMLAQPIEELRQRYEAQRPRLEEAQKQRERMLRSIERRRDALIREATSSYQRLIADIENGIRAEVASVDVGVWDSIANRSEAQQKVKKHIEDWFSARVAEWQTGDLNRIFQAQTAELESEIEVQAAAFLENLEKAKLGLAPGVRSGSVEDVSSANRVLSAVGGFVIGGVGSAIEGASLGFKGMLPGLAVNVAVATTLIVMGFGAPVVIPALLFVGVARTLMGAKSYADRLRDNAATELIKSLRLQIPSTSERISAQIVESFASIQNGLDGALRIKIDEIAGQVQEILREKQAGEAEMKLEQEKLASLRATLATTSRNLEAIRNEVDGALET